MDRTKLVRIAIVLIVVPGLAYFLYAGLVADREAASKREAEAVRIAEEQKAAVQLKARAEQQRVEAEQKRVEHENEAAILGASQAAIGGLVEDCQDQIRGDLVKSPFVPYFPNYSPEDLKKLADIAAAFGKELGRPSVALDSHDFSVTDWNTDRIMQKEYPLRSISMVVEHAQDGFSVRQYAAVYSCHLEGLRVAKPSRDDIYFFD